MKRSLAFALALLPTLAFAQSVTVTINATAPVGTPVPAAWNLVYTPGNNDPAGVFIGGTEDRNATGHIIPTGDPIPSGNSPTGGTCGVGSPTYIAASSGCMFLYSGNGYWEDTDPTQRYAQVLVLSAPIKDGGKWYQDLAMGTGNQANTLTYDKKWITDGNGGTTGYPFNTLVAGSWGSPSAIHSFFRNDFTGTWQDVTLDSGAGWPGTPQTRSGVGHEDITLATPTDYMFIGEDPHGIVKISVTGTPSTTLTYAHSIELMGNCTNGQFIDNCTNLSSDWPTPGVQPPANMHFRVMAMAECKVGAGLTKTLFATAGMQLFKRVDGASPSWPVIWEVPNSKASTGGSASGLRNLTCIPDPNFSDGRQVLFMTTEGSPDYTWRIDPTALSGGVGSGTGCFASDAALLACGTNETDLVQAWKTAFPPPPNYNGYQITGYNQNLSTFNGNLLIGLGSVFYSVAHPPPPPAGHIGFATNDSTCTNLCAEMDAGAYIWQRNFAATPTYTIQAIPFVMAQYPVSTRWCLPSPFADEYGSLYCGGYDANFTPHRNTAWVVEYVPAH